jgi:hypothetical protein
LLLFGDDEMIMWIWWTAIIRRRTFWNIFTTNFVKLPEYLNCKKMNLNHFWKIWIWIH